MRSRRAEGRRPGRTVRATSIGEPQREIEVVPVEDPVPREVPAEPAPEPERVPA